MRDAEQEFHGEPDAVLTVYSVAFFVIKVNPRPVPFINWGGLFLAFGRATLAPSIRAVRWHSCLFGCNGSPVIDGVLNPSIALMQLDYAAGSVSGPTSP